MSRSLLWLIALTVMAFAVGHSGALAAEVSQEATTALAQPAPVSSGIIVPVPVPTASPQAIRLYRSGNVLWIVSTVWGFVVPALIFFTGFSSRLRDLAQRIHPRWYLSLVIYLVFFAFVLFFANLPLDYYSGFLRPHDYGLSSQTLAKWLRDEFLTLAIGIIGGSLVLWIPFLLLKHARKRWWLYTWFASIPILVLITFVEPIWVDPLFNHFGPMQDKALETRILSLASRAGIEGANVYEVNKSVDTNELNAYVTGIGGTKRIVLWDTTLKEFNPDEVALVMSHEMGHYALGHAWKGIVVESFVLLIGLWVVHICVDWMIRRFGARTGVHEIGDFASLPLFMLTFSAVVFLLMPPLLVVSRDYEHEADRFGLEMTHENHSCALVFVKFVQHDLAYPNPSPLVEFFRWSHPSLGDRINFCNTYHPWLQGQEGRYSGYFQPMAGDQRPVR
ncbi:MAG TPA: M48 family metallopeptidase [Steroidobacteraceae bacterium]|jgi:Zn-dependent protease with chaperone function